MQLIIKYNKRLWYLYSVIDLFSKYACVVPLKDKKGVSIINSFQSILKESDRRPTKVLTDQGTEFYKSFKKWLYDNYIKCMQPTMDESLLLLRVLKDFIKQEL